MERSKTGGYLNMSNRFASILFAATVVFAWQSTGLSAHAEGAAKAKVATTGKGHPDKETTAVAVHQTAKPKPAPKAEKVPSALRANSSWVPGDYFWDGDWRWADGYWLDSPWSDAVWIPGHWSDRFWGWTWVPGYWF
jgi:hypothetical protein